MTTAVATRVRLAPPEPSSPRGLTNLVAQLRRQLAQTSATASSSAAVQRTERERLERENAALASQLRTQLAHEVRPPCHTWNPAPPIHGTDTWDHHACHACHAWNPTPPAAPSAAPSAASQAERRPVGFLACEQATYREELAEATRRAEHAEAALDAARASGFGGGSETVQAEFAREARVLGLLSRRDGRHETALRLQQRAKKLHERALGAKHHEVARDLSNIGNCLCDVGRLDDAATAFREAYAIDSTALGADHLHTATDSASIGLVLATQRAWKEATPHLEHAQRVLSSQLEPSHPNLVAVAKFLTECQERLAEAA